MQITHLALRRGFGPLGEMRAGLLDQKKEMNQGWLSIIGHEDFW